ncbi:MAG: family hydrolase [Solirubrobacterales bacterium]|nr:family hydrolase [Solirubrobacterales bacterium]
MIAILDIDGTLVDTNYQHVVAWFRAFRQHDHIVEMWRIHRHMGMGGDKLIASICGDAVEERQGDDIRAAEKPLYKAMIEEVEPLAGARDLMVDLKRLGHTVVLASSAKADELDHYLDLLDARDLADDWTSSADVEETKPAPDIVHSALEKVGAEAQDAVMVGDTPWDIEAAEKAGLPTLAVLTGGFSEAELREAGALDVFETIEALRAGLSGTPLG